jgi:hypothetical protein
VDKQAGTIDVCFNAVGLHVVQNRPLVGMSLEHFLQPITEAASPEPVDLESDGLQALIAGTALGRLPRLAEVADTAAFMPPTTQER